MIARFNSRPIIQRVAAFVALLTFAYLLWAGEQITVQPDIGALWKPQVVGETEVAYVYYAAPQSMFKRGDLIQAVDGVGWALTNFPYAGWARGDIVQFHVERDGRILSLMVPFEQNAPFVIWVSRLVVVFVALIFWLSGTYVVFFSPAQSQQSVLLFLFCQLLAVALAGGTITTRSWLSDFVLMLSWWVVPLSIHLHLLFPFKRTTPRTSLWLTGLYCVPLLGVNHFLHLVGIEAAPDPIGQWTPWLYYWLLMAPMAVIVLLATAYRTTLSPLAKRQVGLVVVFGLVALMPLLSLTLLPILLVGSPLVPIELALIFLGAVPIGYGYASARYEFIKFDRYISRAAVVLIVVVTIGLLYWLLTTGLRRIAPEWLVANQLFNLVVVTSLAVAYPYLRRYLQRWADNLFYGGWYDYSTVVGEISHSLEEASGLAELTDAFSQGIQKTMRVEWACLIVPGGQEGSVVRLAGQADATTLLGDLHMVDIPHIIAYLRRITEPKTHRELQQALSRLESLTPSEQRLLRNSGLRLWVPLLGHHQATGILLLGPKYGGDMFDSADLQILAVVSRQASMAFRNVQLIHQLEEKAQENDQYQKEIVRVREGERKRIALELHDQVIQALVGLKYQLAGLQNHSLADSQAISRVGDVQDGISNLIQTTRVLCHDLRPPALDLGLVPGLRSLISNFEQRSGLSVTLNVDGDRSVPIDEDVALCLYRCTSEALQNVHKHARASRVHVQLTIEPNQLRMTVEDNGRGFAVPQRLGSLMEANHFGLVGMRERIELIDGTFRVASQPASGTCVEACVPLTRQTPPDASEGVTSLDAYLER